jgi:hypothetical protein
VFEELKNTPMLLKSGNPIMIQKTRDEQKPQQLENKRTRIVKIRIKKLGKKT